jgi:hypothetical protein
LISNNSIVDGRLIVSKRLESLQLSLISSNLSGNGSTNIRLSFYNRNSPNLVDVYQLNLTGNWSYVTGTHDTLSCNLIYEPNKQLFSFIQFLSNSSSFNLLAQVPLTSFTNTIQNVSQIASNLVLG